MADPNQLQIPPVAQQPNLFGNQPSGIYNAQLKPQIPWWAHFLPGTSTDIGLSPMPMMANINTNINSGDYLRKAVKILSNKQDLEEYGSPNWINLNNQIMDFLHRIENIGESKTPTTEPKWSPWIANPPLPPKK